MRAHEGALEEAGRGEGAGEIEVRVLEMDSDGTRGVERVLEGDEGRHVVESMREEGD